MQESTQLVITINTSTQPHLTKIRVLFRT